MAVKTTSAQENVSANDSPIYTLFGAEVTSVLTADTILRLAVGVVGAVLVKRFLPLHYARDMMRALEDIRLDSYDERQRLLRGYARPFTWSYGR